MKFLQTLADALRGKEFITPSPSSVPAIRNQPETYRGTEVQIPKLLEAAAWERCERCGQRASKGQLIYSYKGMYFGNECVGRLLILELESPGMDDTQLRVALAKDQQKFRALGMARAARKILEESQ